MRLSATKSFGRPVPETIDWFLGPQIKELDSIRRRMKTGTRARRYAAIWRPWLPLLMCRRVGLHRRQPGAAIRQVPRCQIDQDQNTQSTRATAQRHQPQRTCRHTSARHRALRPANRSQTRAPGNSRRYDHHHDDALLALRPSRLVRTGAVASTGSSVCFCQGFQ